MLKSNTDINNPSLFLIDLSKLPTCAYKCDGAKQNLDLRKNLDRPKPPKCMTHVRN